LVEAGHDVTGTTRTAEGAKLVRALGGHAVQLDVYDRPALALAVQHVRPDAVIHQRTDLAPGGSTGGFITLAGVIAGEVIFFNWLTKPATGRVEIDGFDVSIDPGPVSGPSAGLAPRSLANRIAIVLPPQPLQLTSH